MPAPQLQECDSAGCRVSLCFAQAPSNILKISPAFPEIAQRSLNIFDLFQISLISIDSDVPCSILAQEHSSLKQISL